jgi:catechol 2,3-dioxygenase-like lactoylglutathione lyase family enzyme
MKGFSHVGLSTLDLDATRAFYEGVLGFTAVRCDVIELAEGGRIRHVFFDVGNGEMLAFMEPHGIPGVPVEYDTGINRGLGVPEVFYHVAFDAESHEALVAKRTALLAKGVKVSPIVDHEGWVESIYFKDPNGLLLEYAWQSRVLGEGDADMIVRIRASLRQRSPVLDFRSE